MENCVIKELKPGRAVIMDNAAFHRLQRAKALIEPVDCMMIFLPPYSPDLNPIEKFWANIKRWIKNKISEANKLYDALASLFNIQTSA